MIGPLLRLYPARWRARYGDEFAMLLRERPLGPFDVADVLLGALDAHLHLRGLEAASRTPGGFSMSLKLGGTAAVAGGIMWLVVFGGNAINNGSESGMPWLFLLMVVATLVTLVALTGLSAFQARRDPVLTWLAFAVPAVSGVISLGGLAAMVALGDSDRPIVAGLSSWAVWTIGLVGLVVGSALFALVTWRSHSLSRASAASLGLGALSMFVALNGLAGGVPTPLNVVLILGSILAFSGGWIGLGLSALRLDRPNLPPAAAA